MGIVSQLMDERGGDTDMGTLAELLTGLARGQAVDTTPFGMWGVRNMNPGQLGGAMSAAMEIRQKQLSAEAAADAARFAANAHREGTQSMADAQRYGHDVALANQPVQERIAKQKADALAAAEALRGKTGMEREDMRGQYGLEAARIAAAAKDRPQPLGQLGLGLLQKFRDPKIKSAELQGDIAFLKTMNYNTGPLEELLLRRESDLATKKAEAKPSWWSGSSEPAPPLMRPGSLGEDLYKMKQQQVVPTADYDYFRGMM